MCLLIGRLYVLELSNEQNLSLMDYGPYRFISFGCGDNDDGQDADELKDRS